MDQAVVDAIDSMLGEDNDGVLASLGAISSEHEHQMAPPDVTRWIAAGKAALEYHLDGMRRLLCNNPAILDLRTNNSDERAMAIAIADVLLAASISVPVAQISVLLARVGISRLCKDYRCDEPPRIPS